MFHRYARYIVSLYLGVGGYLCSVFCFVKTLLIEHRAIIPIVLSINKKKQVNTCIGRSNTT